MQSADVLLYPYRKITTSGTLLTGLNYCKPIIASDLPAFRNFLFPNLNALTVTPGDPAALKDAMDYLREDSVFARFEAGCRNNRSLQAQWKDIADRTAAVYATVLH